MTSDVTAWSDGSFGRFGRGSRIAGYLIEEQIGAGGMAIVFRARDEMLGRLVALKVIAPSMANDPEFRVRFLRESRAAAAVDSPYIIPVYATGEVGGLPYIATRFVAGGDLAALVRRAGGFLDPERAASLVAQVASALDAAHAAGLVHRDVKPQNILVDTAPEGPEHAYLADFGLSKRTHSSSGLTATGQFLGTPDYCAPEQIRGLEVDVRADQYALACVAFVLLTGSPPFHRDDAMATLFAQVHDPVPPVTRLRPDLPPAVDAVITRALAKSPADRYLRCREFARALQDALPPAHPSTIADHPPRPTEDDRIPGTRQALRQSPAEVTRSSVPPPAPHKAQPLTRPRPYSSQPSVRGPWSRALDWFQRLRVSDRHPLIPESARDKGLTGVTSAGHASTIPAGNGSARRGRVRWLGRAPAAWTAGAVVVLAAGAGGAALFLAPSQDNVSANHAPSHPDTADVITSRVLAGDDHGFKAVGTIAVDDSHVWITNGNSVTQLNASNGNRIQTVSSGNYGFSDPAGIVADGPDIWVTNYTGASVTELNASNGAWVRTVTGASYDFSRPWGIAVDGPDIWVANEQNNSVTELNASNGNWIRTLSGGNYDFDAPIGIAADRDHVRVTNSYEDATGDSVTELNASNGAWVRTLSGGNYGFQGPLGITDDGTHVWVTNSQGTSVTELSASSGNWIQTLAGRNYAFYNPDAIAFDGTHIWVANSRNSVTELNAGNGSWIRTLSGSHYGFNYPYDIVADGTHTWITNADGNSVTELTSE